MAEKYRSRRTRLAVPGSNPRFLEKARGLAAGEVFFDLEDAVRDTSAQHAPPGKSLGQSAGQR